MKIFADFHIHSPYSRAVSKEMTLENIHRWAQLKGINVIGTGDFTHPIWFEEIKTKLEPAEEGLYKLKTAYIQKEARNKNLVRFILTVEISSIYSKGGKTRRIHNLIFAPDIETVEKINVQLGWEGNLKSDGRPILGLDSKELAKIVLNTNENCLIVPAHAWTPWFSIFGSMSGFDSIEECFEEYSKYIYAIETGLSSDPAMNWRLSALDKISLISNSDSHSLKRIGREANVFNTELSYSKIMDAIKSKDPKKFLFTIEFFPEEGKYHYDGHRSCGFSCSPEETENLNKICPKCKRPLTVGVMNRVKELADRKEGEKPNQVIPFKNLVPLDEIIAEAFGVGNTSKRVQEEYLKLVENLNNEFYILYEADPQELTNYTTEKIVEGILKVREGKVKVIPGYDGEYGKVKIFENNEEQKSSKQKTLF